MFQKLCNCCCFGVLFGLLSVPPDSHAQPVASALPHPRPNAEVILGGSFSPPTIEHASIVALAMYRLGIQKGRMRVAVPYKKGAAPAEVSLRLTQVAVEHFYEVLDLLALEYSGFFVVAPGRVKWFGPGSQIYELRADDSEIRQGIVTNALASIQSLGRELGSPKNVYWVSGADSFSSIQSWTENWHDLLEGANWVVVNREGSEFEFGGEDRPLDKVLGDYGQNLEHRFEPRERMHRYWPKSGEGTQVLFLEKPSFPISSSSVRKAFEAGSDPNEVYLSLQPSVYRTITQNGYYLEDTELSRLIYHENALADYLAQFFDRMNQVSLNDKESRELERASIELVRYSKNVVKTSKDKSLVIGVLVSALNGVKSVVDIKQFLKASIKKANETYGKAILKYGIGFAGIFAALELVEWVLVPSMAYAIGGKTGLLFAPFIHQEFVSIPLYLAYMIKKERRTKANLADPTRPSGDLELYRKMIDFRNRQMRGNPERVVASYEVQGAWGVGDGFLPLQIVRSQFPAWVPLRVRRWFDKKTRWYDMNLSINELGTILQNPEWMKALKAKAGDNQELFARLLFVACSSDSEALLRLQLFTGARYFRTLHLGEVSDAVAEGFSADERAFVAEAQALASSFKKELHADQLRLLANTATYTFLIVQAHRRGMLEDPMFWKTTLDLIMGGYPYASTDWTQPRYRAVLSLKLGIIGQTIAQQFPELIPEAGLKMFMDNSSTSSLLTLYRSDTLESIRGRLTNHAGIQRARSIMDAAVGSALSRYVSTLRRYFLPERPALEFSARALPVDARSLRGFNNLLWGIRLQRETFRRRFENLHRSFQYGLRYLDQRQGGKEVRKYFKRAQIAVLKQVQDTALIQIQRLEYDLLAQLMAQPWNPDPSKMEDLKKRWAHLKGTLNWSIESYQKVIKLMNGGLPLALTDQAIVLDALVQATSESRETIEKSRVVRWLGDCLGIF